MQVVNFLKSIFETDDLDFYDNFLKDTDDVVLKSFWDENPKFLSEFPISKEHRYLLKDRVYHGILHDIQKYKGKNS